MQILPLLELIKLWKILQETKQKYTCNSDSIPLNCIEWDSFVRLDDTVETFKRHADHQKKLHKTAVNTVTTNMVQYQNWFGGKSMSCTWFRYLGKAENRRSDTEYEFHCPLNIINHLLAEIQFSKPFKLCYSLVGLERISLKRNSWLVVSAENFKIQCVSIPMPLCWWKMVQWKFRRKLSNEYSEITKSHHLKLPFYSFGTIFSKL